MKKKNKTGFTLFELMIVLVLVGLISLLALPRFFNSMTHVELKSAARKTISLLHQARDIAYFQKKQVKVSFNLETDQISVFEKNAETFEPLENIKYFLPEGITIKDCQKKEVIVSEGIFDILFSPSGSSTGGRIRLTNEKKRVYELEIDFITGTARILE